MTINYRALSLLGVSFLLIAAKPENKKPALVNNKPETALQKPLDLSLPNPQPKPVDETLNLELQKTTEQPNIFSSKKKPRDFELKGKLLMSPDTEKSRSTVDGATVTMDLKL